MRLLSAFTVGLIFGVGIAISGMINPAKVLNFFDIAGTWDPSLIFVMGGALVTTFVGYRFVLRRDRPVIEERFQLPSARDIDARLVGGSAVFGVGWGIAGFCPGAAVPALGSGKAEVAGFVVALLAGLWVARMIRDRQAGKGALA
jgi:uncharacterized membrane protein YedE/YeeE